MASALPKGQRPPWGRWGLEEPPFNSRAMSADGDNKPLSSGISIPQWMKSRIGDTRLGFDESAFSPPENDDSFLYIRYPPSLAKKLRSPVASRRNSNSNPVPSVVMGKLDTDLANHTAPYQPSIAVADLKTKSPGTDDGFKGEGAACGSSVIRVAHQIISGKLTTNNPVDEDPLKPRSFDPLKRRGSKSLPVTPISSPQGSPKSQRRLANRYFTGPFVDNDSQGSSWILQGLLSRRDISQSVGYIAEESTKEELERTKSALRINEPKLEKKVKEFKAKPSEFRELNFWSPTSM